MTIFLDASAIIYWVEAADSWFDRLQDVLFELRKRHGEIGFAVSLLSLLECRIKPLREGNQEVLDRYTAFFGRPDLVQVSLDGPVIELGTHLRARHSLSTPDALQAASALSLGSDVVFVTGDDAFGKVQGLTVRRV